MRTAAFITHELRTQARSLRFRVAVATYVALGTLPAVVLHLQPADDRFFLGGATLAAEMRRLLPLLTAVLSLLLSLDGIGRERSSNAWTTVALTDLTNAGYLLRRWIALLAVVAPLTAVPVLATAGLALAGGHREVEPALFWGPWLVHILPLAVLGTTLGLGLGTLGGGGGGMGTFVAAALFGAALPRLADGALSRLGYGFQPPVRWLDLDAAAHTADRIGRALSGSEAPNDEGRFLSFPLPETEAGFDLRLAAEQSLADGLLFATIALTVLALAVAQLRRTRPDLRPWTVRPDHPLRSFLAALGRLREAFVPDPALARADRLAITLLLLLAAACGAASVARLDAYDERAWRQVRAEMNPPPPTPRDVLPGLWRVEGTVAADGAVALRVAGTLRNTGTAPQGRLAFALNPELEVTAATAGSGRMRASRAWDRLAVELDPPLRPGESRELRFRLEGRPAVTVLPKRPKPQTLVDDAFGAHQRARFGRDLIDFSTSYRIPSVSGYRVRLKAEDLFPVPRYGPWTRTEDDGLVEITPEVFFPESEVRLALAVPPDLFLADACGGLARDGRLESRCRLPLSHVEVAGGRHRRLEGPGMTVAVFPAHRAAGELHLGFLARGSRMILEAWPGAGGLDEMVILEWPTEEVHARHHDLWHFGRYRFAESLAEMRGRMILLQEADLIHRRALDPERMVAEIVASRLARRRRLDAGQQTFFFQLFRTLALQRLGLGPQGGAVLALDPKDIPLILHPALEPPYPYWRHRFPALLIALERRTGREPLRAAVDELLDGDSERPATFAEFEAILARHAQRPVDGLIRDFFRAGRLPELVLEGVRFDRAGEGWRATGRVRNLGDGEAICRVVLNAAVAPSETEVAAGTGETVPFTLSTPHRPQSVVLDPDRECHRLERGPGRDRVYFRGEQR